jgi:CRP-like cAMP-binding protein
VPPWFGRSAAIAGLPVEFPPNPKNASPKGLAFNMQLFLDSTGLGKTAAAYYASDIVFSRGDLAKNALHVQEGNVKMAVANESGGEVAVAILGPEDLLGER